MNPTSAKPPAFLSPMKRPESPPVAPKKYDKPERVRWRFAKMRRTSPILHLIERKKTVFYPLPVSLCGFTPFPSSYVEDAGKSETVCPVCDSEADRILEHERELASRQYEFHHDGTMFKMSEAHKAGVIGWRIYKYGTLPPKIVKWFPDEDMARQFGRLIEKLGLEKAKELLKNGSHTTF